MTKMMSPNGIKQIFFDTFYLKRKQILTNKTNRTKEKK